MLQLTMSRLFFYVPFLYLYHTRQRSLRKLLSWALVYLIPACMLALMQGGFSPRTLAAVVLGAVLIYDFYETGYIQNDTETIKREKAPSMRLQPDELAYYERNTELIYGWRLLLGAPLAVGLILLVPHPCPFVVAALSILVVYQFYNSVRSRWNLYLYVLLITLRYCTPQLLFIEQLDPALLAASFFAYPLANILERASFPKFRIGFMQRLIGGKEGIPAFRIRYYAVLLVITAAIALFDDGFDLRICLLFAYYLVVRILFRLLNAPGKGMFIYYK